MNGGREFEKRKAQFRAAIIHDAGLSLAARLVGYEIADSLNNRTGDAWPGQDYLANKLGIAVRTVRRAVADLVRAGWFSTELDGRAWRYMPNYGRTNGTPDNLAGVDTGHLRQKHRTFTPETPDKKVPLSSLENHLREPSTACGQLDAPSNEASNDEGRGQQDKVVAILADQSEAITQQARRAGAPVFVFENSEPWRAWIEYRRSNNIPGSMPTRQRMHLGRWRTGWDAPTLFPPGYNAAKRSGGER